MYHQQPSWKTFILSVFLGFIFLSGLCPGSLASVPDKSRSAALEGHVSERPILEFPVLPCGHRFKEKPRQAVIYQLDLKPLGNRRPLLLVHGLRGEYRKLFRWDKVIKHILKSRDFNDHFKVYLLRYDSTASLKVTVPQFKKALLRLQDFADGKQVSILALSLGGNLVEESVRDSKINSAVAVVFTMGTPFHGSPLFSPDWYQYSLYKNLSLPWTRVDHSLSYRFYFARNPFLLSELEWDNADGFMPDAGHFRSLLPLGPKGNLTVNRDGNERLQRMNRQSNLDKSKFITYAGYLLNPYLMPTLRRQFDTTILAPYTLLTVKLPAHLAREHPVLKMLNHEISRTIPREHDGAKPDNWPHVYGLNDGITPVNSAIFLPSEELKANPVDRENSIARLRSVIDVKVARVFRNIDHLTFVDAYRPGSGSPLIRDELNPEDGYRHIFDWILTDLLSSEPIPSQVARDAAGDLPPGSPAGGKRLIED